MKLAGQIAATAREVLGRDAIAPKRGCNPDWDAWDAIVTAARRHGLRERFGSYVTRAPTLRGMARDYAARYTQAYGPVDGVIDVSRGRSAPMPVETGDSGIGGARARRWRVRWK